MVDLPVVVEVRVPRFAGLHVHEQYVRVGFSSSACYFSSFDY